MKTRCIALAAVLLSLAANPATSRADFEITLDSGSGTETFTDTDEDGVIEFDTTVSGIFRASGTLTEYQTPVRTNLSIGGNDPELPSIFRNESASPQTFTMTVRSTDSGLPIPTAVGWWIGYSPTADDLVDMSVDVPAHSVIAKINDDDVTLGTLTADPLTSAGQVFADLGGTDFDHPVRNLSFTWTFTLGPNDQLRIAPYESQLSVSVFNQKAKCVSRMTLHAERFGYAAMKTDSRCLGETGDVTACVDAPRDARTVERAGSLANDFASRCDPLPSWGVEDDACCVGGTSDGAACIETAECGGGDCREGACIASAGEAAASAIAHDLFGPSVVMSSDGAVYDCQRDRLGDLLKLYKTMWKTLRRCTQSSFLTIAGDEDLKATCLMPISQTDLKVADVEQSIAASFADDCFFAGMGTVFPGACAEEPDATFAACLIRQASCRFCESANAAAAIDPPADCDVFDDGEANASCP